MKKITLVGITCFMFLFGRSQWTTSGNNIYNSNSGNVGVGTASPGQKLTVSGGIRIDDAGVFTGAVNGTNDGLPWLSFGNSITGEGIGSNRTTGSVNQFGIDFYTSYGRRMCITNSGAVGIGTTNTQGYLLAVNGSAIFTSAFVKPYGNWPDYVFAKNYRLFPLDSLSQYIQINHHLPDVPSADSVQRKGIDLGGNQASLLKKVEELTLYLIAQDQELKSLSQQNRNFQELAQKLEQQNTVLRAQQEKIDKLEQLINNKGNN
jgi:hypothetical protein